MSYTVWDLAHDRYCKLEDDYFARQDGYEAENPDGAMTLVQLTEELRLLELEVEFYASHPEIGGRDARDPIEVAAANTLFLAYYNGTLVDKRQVSFEKQNTSTDKTRFDRLLLAAREADLGDVMDVSGLTREEYLRYLTDNF